MKLNSIEMTNEKKLLSVSFFFCVFVVFKRLNIFICLDLIFQINKISHNRVYEVQNVHEVTDVVN